MKAYEMIIENGVYDNQVYKVVRPAHNEKQLKVRYGGNGEFVRIKDVTEFYQIDLDALRRTLTGKQTGIFGEVETDIIVSLVQQMYDNTCC